MRFHISGLVTAYEKCISFAQLCSDEFTHYSGELPNSIHVNCEGFGAPEGGDIVHLAPWMMNQNRRVAYELPILVSFQLYTTEKQTGFSFLLRDDTSFR